MNYNQFRDQGGVTGFEGDISDVGRSGGVDVGRINSSALVSKEDMQRVRQEEGIDLALEGLSDTLAMGQALYVTAAGARLGANAFRSSARNVLEAAETIEATSAKPPLDALDAEYLDLAMEADSVPQELFASAKSRVGLPEGQQGLTSLGRYRALLSDDTLNIAMAEPGNTQGRAVGTWYTLATNPTQAELDTVAVLNEAAAVSAGAEGAAEQTSMTKALADKLLAAGHTISEHVKSGLSQASENIQNTVSKIRDGTYRPKPQGALLAAAARAAGAAPGEDQESFEDTEQMSADVFEDLLSANVAFLEQWAGVVNDLYEQASASFTAEPSDPQQLMTLNQQVNEVLQSAKDLNPYGKVAATPDLVTGDNVLNLLARFDRAVNTITSASEQWNSNLNSWAEMSADMQSP